MHKENNLDTQQLFRKLLLITLLLTLLTVVLSAYIRLSVNGLGCEPWPGCYGYIGHGSHQQGIDVLTEPGKSMPHSGIRKMHRLVASLLGITILMIVILAYRQRKLPSSPGMTVPLLLLGMTMFLSILGYSTPSPDLPVVTVSNLLGGISMLAMLWWLWCRIHSSTTETDEADKSRLRPVALTALLILFVQTGLGGWTSGYLAAAACNELFTCNPAVDWSIPAILDSYSPFTRLETDNQGMVLAENHARIVNVIHRLGAVVSCLVLGWLLLQLRSLDGRIRMLAWTIFSLLFLQIFLGVTGIMSQLPILLVTTHNTVAALMLMALTDLNYQLKPRVV